MAKTRPRKPIESFGPELFRALIEGAKKEIIIDLPYRKASHLRMRIHQLRNEMRLQQHPQYGMASQAVIAISWPDDTEVNKSSRGVRFPKDPNVMCKVRIAPADNEFSDALKAAGVTIPDFETPTLDGSDIADDILSSYVKDNP